MKLSNLDRVAGMPSVRPLSDALQWLDTLTKAPGVAWHADQLAAARAALLAAREVMNTDVLTLAAIHFPNAEPARVADKVADRIDRVEAETAAATRAQEDACSCPCCLQGVEAPHEYHLERRPMANPPGPRDIQLPDGTVRHNVGSDNLSDEDRASMVLTDGQVQALNEGEQLDREAEAFVNARWAAADAYLAEEWPTVGDEARAVARDIYTNVMAQPSTATTQGCAACETLGCTGACHGVRRDWNRPGYDAQGWAGEAS